MATETTSADAAASAPGMPQLDFSTWGNQIFWLVITLVVIYMVLSRVALPRIAAILAERQGTITSDLAAAEDLKSKAKDAEAAYDKALIDARAEAQRIVAEAKADIQKDLDKAIAAADAEIAEKSAESEKAIGEIRAGAMAAVKEVAGETAQAIVSAMGANPDAAEIDAAVSARLKG
ncbi:F0F1 ATP synthase subunit B' [uncultured Roseobacter sp.]|uniref:F0F1 ATP synthase subunit B' n=1 Tax=uncultured Roseobacter sp. TaxID=114847 RepID=UPI0026228481|nr:F0F1 ATP synthase subunit B' [uncultured Roseobacter sp.]